MPARRIGLMLLGALALGCSQNNASYNMNVKLVATSDGGPLLQRDNIKEGVASLSKFTCDVSVRLGQCIDGKPIQLVLVPGEMAQSGGTTCGSRSARQRLLDSVNGTIGLGRDAGMLWIQAFHGDDDDDSGLVDRSEMDAYAELRHGTITVHSYDDDTLNADITATSDDMKSVVSGSLGAENSDKSGRVGVGPRCTWAIMAKPN